MNRLRAFLTDGRRHSYDINAINGSAASVSSFTASLWLTVTGAANSPKYSGTCNETFSAASTSVWSRCT